MCLSKQTRIYHRRGVGYKVFIVSEGLLYTPFQGKRKMIPIGKWIAASGWSYSRARLWDDQYTTYPPGWHISLTKIGARKYLDKGKIIYKVEYKDTVAEGLQNRNLTVVTRWMKILEKVE